MKFHVSTNRFLVTPTEFPCVILVRDTWNDYGYVTTHHLFFVSSAARDDVKIGTTKILQRQQTTTTLPEHFSELGDEFASAGQDDDYYRRLSQLPGDAGLSILRSLRDLGTHFPPTAEVRDDPGFKSSLLRDQHVAEVLARASTHFTTHDAPPTSAGDQLDLLFTTALKGFSRDHLLTINFDGRTHGMGRIGAIVGQNGVGKTQLLTHLASVLTGLEPSLGNLAPKRRYRVMALSFSAFDSFTRARWDTSSYIYRGLVRPSPAFIAEARPPTDRRIDMAFVFEQLMSDIAALRAETPSRLSEVTALLGDLAVFEREPHLPDVQSATARSFVDALSTAASGHQMLVLLVVALVRFVDAGTIVLWDEPETHLHPQLLTAAIRTMYQVLAERKAFALVATHSPIVVQEIPREFVRVIRVESRIPTILTYERESFGETLGDIVQYAFGVDEDSKSYPTILAELSKTMTYDQIMTLFGGGLGLGARLALRASQSSRTTRGGS